MHEIQFKASLGQFNLNPQAQCGALQELSKKRHVQSRLIALVEKRVSHMRCQKFPSKRTSTSMAYHETLTLICELCFLTGEKNHISQIVYSPVSM